MRIDWSVINMAIFWLGGEERILTDDEIVMEPDEETFFLPGIIHGCEYIIGALYYWSDGVDKIEIDYLYPSIILECEEDTKTENGLDEDEFFALLWERAERFIVENDGSGDFVTLNEVWEQGIDMSAQDIIDWAVGIE